MKDGIGGREHNPEQPNAWNGNHHPTVKPISLMRYLTRLITPPGGLVLDPFMGSGTTGVACVYEGFRFIGIEQEAEYVRVARARIFYAKKEIDTQYQ
jgi:DNA modification methylase